MAVDLRLERDGAAEHIVSSATGHTPAAEDG